MHSLISLGLLSPFLRNSAWEEWDELESKDFSFAGKVFEGPFFVLFFVTILTDINIGSTKLHHAVNQ